MDKDLSVIWDISTSRFVMGTDLVNFAKTKRILQCLIHNGIEFTERGDPSKGIPVI